MSLFHTPELTHAPYKYLPSPFNEVIGLTHLKVYLFDDTLIMSGFVQYSC